jgi:putative peptidoglycan lipid II flippase
VSSKKLKELKESIIKSIRFILFICIPLTLILFFYNTPFIKVLFERGLFNSNDTFFTSKILSYYLLALFPAALGEIVAKAYYSLKDSKTPMYTSIFSVVFYILFIKLSLQYIGIIAIPIAFTFSYYFSLITNSIFLKKKIGAFKFSGTIKYIIKISLFGCISIAFTGLIYNLLDNAYLKLILIFGSFIIYIILAYLFKIEELLFLINKIKVKK